MFKAISSVFGICSLIALISLGCSARAEPTSSDAEKLLSVVPDDVVGFVATSGGDELKPAFEKSVLGRMWNDAGVQSFYQSIKKELLSKIKQEMPDANAAKVPDIVIDLVKLVVKRPIIMGAARKQATTSPPVYGFAILDAGPRKAEIASAIAKLEAMADKGDIVEIEVGGVKMHGPSDADEMPGYWGWVGSRFVFAINDGEGLAIKYLQKRRATAPGYLGDVPGAGDALAVYVDREKMFEILGVIASMEGGQDEFDTVKAVINELGIGNIKTFTARMGFSGSDMVSDELVRLEGPRVGLLASLGTVDLSMFDMVDAGAVNAGAINWDVGGIYDTVMRAIKAASPEDAYPEIEESIAEFEVEAKLSIRKGLLESLSGPIVFYTLPAGVIMEAPTGGVVVIAKLKDVRLWEKTVTALGDFATAQSEGMLQVSSQVQEGRTLYCWVIPPLAMMQVIPTWTIVDNHVVVGSNAALCNKAVKQINSAKMGKNSIRTTDGYKKVAAKLREDLILFRYTNSKLQFNQMMVSLQQFWPMITMMAGQQGIKLPFMLPSLGHIVKDMEPSCQYSWFDGQGLRSHYQGPGVEPSIGAVAGVSVGGAAVLMPALARTREVAHRVVSGSNLAGIGKACVIYAMEEDEGKYPPTLDKLVELDYITAKQLESPLKPKGFDGPSYIYISGQSAASEPRNIVAYDNPEFCDEGVDVLFVDGHVEWMKREEFLRELEATYKRLGKEMPEIRFKGDKPAVSSAHNLHLLGLALNMWATDHKGKLPKTLEETKPYCPDLKLPESPRKPKDFAGPSYIYVWHETPYIRKVAYHIVAYENPEFCEDKIAVLFRDFSVRAMSQEEFLKALEETYKHLGKEVPKVKFKESKEVRPLEEPRALGTPGTSEAEAEDEAKRLALRKAVTQGDLDTVKSLIADGADVNAKYGKRGTALYLAIESGHMDVVRLLIDKGADVNARGGRWFTPLHLAARFGQTDIAELLIAKGGNIDEGMKGNGIMWTPLHLAVRFGNTDVAKLLIAKGADMYAETNQAMTPMLFAVIHNRPEIEKLLLSKGAQLDIFSASIRGDTNRVAGYLKSDPNLVNAKRGEFTPLHWAAYNGHLDVAKLLIGNGADVNANFEHAPPLYWAVRKDYVDMIKLLTAEGANVNVKNSHGSTLLHGAVTAGAVEMLIDKGADVNAKDKEGATPLHMVASKGAHKGILKLLIPFDADSTAKHSRALHAKAEEGQVTVAKLLISNGANVNARDKKGRSPLDIAEKSRYKAVAEVLRKYQTKDTAR